MKEFNTPGEALAYIADCQLATVGHMAMIKRKSKYEYERQISIAAICVAAAVRYSDPADVAKTRINEVAAVGSIEAYAKAIEDRA